MPDDWLPMERTSTALCVAVEHCNWAKSAHLLPAEVLLGFGMSRGEDPATWDEVTFRIAALWLELNP